MSCQPRLVTGSREDSIAAAPDTFRPQNLANGSGKGSFIKSLHKAMISVKKRCLCPRQNGCQKILDVCSMFAMFRPHPKFGPKNSVSKIAPRSQLDSGSMENQRKGKRKPGGWSALNIFCDGSVHDCM